MQQITRTLARARRRLFVGRLVHRLGWALLAATVVCIVIALAAPALALPWPMWGYGGVYGGAIVLAWVLAALRPPSRRETAVMIDSRLGLKDRLGSALYVAESEPDHPFRQTILEDAERAASSAALREAFPVEATAVWRWVPVTAALLAVLVVFLDASFDPFGLRKQKEQQLAEEQLEEQSQQQIEEAIALIEDIAPPDEEDADADDLMEQLEAMLSQRDLSNPQFDDQAELSALQEKLDEVVQHQQDQLNAMQTAMSRLETEEHGPADRFVEAMRRGDFDAARRQLEKLAEQLDNGDLSPEQKQALQNQLDQLAEQLDDMAQQQQQQQQQAASSAAQQMQDAGVSQQQSQQIAQQMQQQGMTPQQMQQQLQDAGLTEQQAQQLAEQLQQQQQQMQQSQNNQSVSSNLGKALGQMSEAMKQGQKASPAGQPGQQQLGQMSQMQQQLNQMQQAQQQLQNAQQGAQGQQGTAGGSMPGAGRGVGGSKAGTGDGGNPLGEQRADPGRGSSAVADLQDGRGKVIASWQTRGDAATGEAKLQYDAAVTEAQESAEHAVTDDRAPRRYHRAIRDYFGNLPESPQGEE